MMGGEDRIRFCLDQALLLVDWDFDQSRSHTRFHDKVWYKTRLMMVGMSNWCQHYWH